MKNKLNHILSLCVLLAFSFTAVSCGTTDGVKSKLPPITVIGKWQGKPIEVTVYPDGSKPTEVKIDGLPEGPIVIDTTKKL